MAGFVSIVFWMRAVVCFRGDQGPSRRGRDKSCRRTFKRQPPCAAGVISSLIRLLSRNVFIANLSLQVHLRSRYAAQHSNLRGARWTCGPLRM